MADEQPNGRQPLNHAAPAAGVRCAPEFFIKDVWFALSATVTIQVVASSSPPCP
jgi:hypothetical protein